ncbi:Fc.00g082620.m01.CDS01 [Cosmosporella sp. VM-42]
MAIDEHHLRNSFRQWRTTPVEQYIKASQNSPQREMLHFPALLFQVLAQIMHNLAPEHPIAKTLKISDYADCDRRQNPTLCSVEHDIIAGAWLKDSSDGTQAWYRLGDAVRQAQELGLHRLPQSVEQASDNSLESNLLRTWDLEHQKRIWTRLFILDSLLALMLGRPRLINREDFSTPIPLNIEYPKDPVRTLPLSSDNSPFSGMLIFLTLAHKIHDILSLSAKGVFTGDYSKLLAIHDEIFALRYKLPLPAPSIRSSLATNTSTLRLSILWLSLLNSINAVLVALHRPLITSHPASRSAAVSAALEGLDLQHSIFDLVPHSQSRFYGTVFSTVEACIFLCGIMVELPPQDEIEDRRIRQGILQGMGRLSAIKDRSALAESGEQILRQFYQEIQAARKPTFEQSSQFSSQPQQPQMPEETYQLRDISIPSPQQPSYENWQSIFGSGQNPAGPFEMLEDQDWDFEYPSQDNAQDFLNHPGLP